MSERENRPHYLNIMHKKTYYHLQLYVVKSQRFNSISFLFHSIIFDIFFSRLNIRHKQYSDDNNNNNNDDNTIDEINVKEKRKRTSHLWMVENTTYIHTQQHTIQLVNT